jgi:hypothetical protein
MVQGFVSEHREQTVQLAGWVEGPPKKAFMRGIDIPVNGGMPIGAFRCKQCGYMEFYADEIFAAKK